jgi:hypothetical protein
MQKPMRLNDYIRGLVRQALADKRDCTCFVGGWSVEIIGKYVLVTYDWGDCFNQDRAIWPINKF